MPDSTKSRAARDAEICRRYRAGETIAEIRLWAGLSHGRVHQVLRANGVGRNDRPVPHNGRDEFLGIELEDLTKVALRQEAKRRGISMSRLSAETIRQMLIDCGYPLEAEKIAR
jgi:hypothetical protein